MTEEKELKLSHKLKFRPTNIWWATRNGNTHLVSPWNRPDIMLMTYSVEGEDRGGYVVKRIQYDGYRDEKHFPNIYQVSDYLKKVVYTYGDLLNG